MPPTASSTQDPARQLTGGDPRRVRETYQVLERLLAILFPGEPPVDIITVADILYRYPLTGFKAPALAAMEQSQRIVRSRANFSLVGLSEFHLGLIYFYWDDCRAAANHFARAQQAWSLVSDAAAICLAHYAHGAALFLGLHNEPAMVQYSRAERLLTKPAGSSQTRRLDGLRAEMTELLHNAQATLREIMWPKDQVPAELLEAGYLTVPADAGVRPAESMTPERSSAQAVQSASPPTEPSAERPEWVRRVPQPISQLPGSQDDARHGPVPGHVTTDDRFGWYQIGQRRGSFLAAVAPGTWLLADREVDDRPPLAREYVVIGSARAGLGDIAIQAISHTSAVPYYYLGQRLADEDAPGGSRLVLDESGRSPAARDAFVLAVVEGFWLGLGE